MTEICDFPWKICSDVHQNTCDGRRCALLALFWQKSGGWIYAPRLLPETTRYSYCTKSLLALCGGTYSRVSSHETAYISWGLTREISPVCRICLTPSTGRCRRGLSDAVFDSKWWRVELFWFHPPPILLKICPTRLSIKCARGRCLTKRVYLAKHSLLQRNLAQMFLYPSL